MNPKSYRTAYQKRAERECEEFLKKVRKPAAWQPSRIVIEDGAPNFLLRDCVRDLDIDLVVLGTRGRNAIFEMIVGSVAKVLMEEVPCDILVIREPRAAAEELGRAAWRERVCQSVKISVSPVQSTKK